MARRTTPQSKTDDLAFPVRIKLAVPPTGLGRDLDRIHRWLDDALGTGNYACHSAPGIACEAMAIYFRHPNDAAAFVAALPDLPLADGTLSPVYASPSTVRHRQ